MAEKSKMVELSSIELIGAASGRTITGIHPIDNHDKVSNILRHMTNYEYDNEKSLAENVYAGNNNGQVISVRKGILKSIKIADKEVVDLEVLVIEDVRKVVDVNEVTVQKNAINVNGSWYIVGENIPTGNYLYKADKEQRYTLFCRR